MLAEIGLNGLQLLQSVERGDVRIIEEVLREHPHMMNQKVINNQEETLLFRAAMEKQVDIVRLLLSRGADPNIPCSVFSNETAIFQVCSVASPKNIEIAQLLLRKGARLNIFSRGMQRSPLHKAILGGESDVSMALLQHQDVPINALDANHSSALHYALRFRHVELWVALEMVRRGARLFGPLDDQHCSPLDYLLEVQDGGDTLERFKRAAGGSHCPLLGQSSPRPHDDDHSDGGYNDWGSDDSGDDSRYNGHIYNNDGLHGEDALPPSAQWASPPKQLFAQSEARARALHLVSPVTSPQGQHQHRQCMSCHPVTPRSPNVTLGAPSPGPRKSLFGCHRNQPPNSSRQAIKRKNCEEMRDTARSKCPEWPQLVN